MPDSSRLVTRENHARALPGFVMFPLNVAWLIASVVLMISSAASAHAHPGQMPWGIPGGFLGIALGILAFFGYFTLQPNEARVQILFGSYKGTVRTSGFHWANPFYSRSRVALGKLHGLLSVGLPGASQSNRANSTKLSLRVHNFNSETLKVNDK